jgi:antitoxin MazE
MEVTLNKWGNSFGIRIPNIIIKELSLEEGAKVQIMEENNRIIIYPIKENLKSLLEKVTKENIHSEIDFDASTGNEVW